MLLAGAFGPVLEGPGKEPPLPSEPSGTFGVLEAQPAVPVGDVVAVGVVGAVGVGFGVGVVDCEGGTAVGAWLGVALPLAGAVAVVVAVTVAVAVTWFELVTVTAAGFGTVHTIVIC